MSQSLTLAVASAIAISGSAMAGIFGSGNIVVERVGNGTTTLSSAATAVSVIEMNTAGVTQQQLDLPTSGGTQVTDSGSATSNGYLNVYNGLLAVSGYNAASGTASVAGSNTKVGTVIGSDGNVSNATRTLFPTSGTMPFTNNNFRSMIATGANTFYASGTSSGTTPSTGGVWYANNGNFTQISSTATGQPTNMRNVEIYGGNLYTSSGVSTGYGVWQVGTGLATTAGQTSTLLINAGTNASTYGFVLFDTNSDGTNDLAYLADDRTTAGGGLQKWVLTGGTWTNSWSVLVNATGATSTTAATGFAGIRGLTGTWDALNGAQLFATTTETNNNRVIGFSDTGTTPTSFTNLASAGTNYVFRGVDLTAVPAPGAAALLGLAGLITNRRRK
jgi:hypothetical protein